MCGAWDAGAAVRAMLVRAELRVSNGTGPPSPLYFA